MLTIRQLKNKIRKLNKAAKDKLAEIKDDTSADDSRTIEAAHAELIEEIRELEDEIKTRVETDGEGGDEGDEGTGGKKRKAKDDDEDDDDSEDDNDTKGKKGSSKDRSGAGILLRASVVSEMVLIDSQMRELGVDLDLPDCIARGELPDAMRKRGFAELAKKSKEKGPKGSTSPDVQVIRDEAEGRSAAMEIALATRMLASRGRHAIKYEPKDLQERAIYEKHKKQAEQYMGMGIIDMAAACIDYKGRGLITARIADDILTRAFQSTSDFPNIFQNALNKSLLARYELAMPTYRRIAIERNFNDFRPHPQIRAGDFPQLQPVSETGELRYGGSQDNSETASVLPYGVVFTISRIMLVNDDLGAIDQILGSAGQTVLIFENTTFFNMLTSAAGVGPTLVQDTTAVFNYATHNNLAAASNANLIGGPPSITTIGQARQAIRGMRSLGGLYLNAAPKIILGGPAQETVIDQMVTAIAPTLTTSVNPFSGRLEAAADANISDASWYIFSDPAQVPCFIYGFLNGANGPRIRTFEPFGVQGVKVSLEHDFGCGAIDYRGVVRNAGA